MSTKVPTHKFYLGRGFSLYAFALDPNIEERDLADMLSSRYGTAGVLDLEALANGMSVVARLDSLGGLEINVSKEEYRVPEQLQTYRDVLDVKLPKLGQYNGDIMVVKGDVKIPLTLFKAGFFDFKATELISVPADVLPNMYPKHKTLRDLLPEYGLEINQLARYLGFAFIMLPDNGNEIGFVQRAKGLGIAPDCMALSGCTPPFHKDFFEEGFNFQQYFEDILKKEMKEEYKLLPHEFTLGKSYFINDKGSNNPFIAIEIRTPLSTKEIARRAFGDKEVIKEHPILYSISPMATGILTQKFPLFYSTPYILNLVARDMEYKA